MRLSRVTEKSRTRALLTRRAFTAAGVACLCRQAHGEPPPAARPLGCTRARISLAYIGQTVRLYSGSVFYDLSQGSGDSDLDGMLSGLAFQIVKVFEIPRPSYPAILFYDDSETPNCFQIADPDPKKPVVVGTCGVVALGATIVDRLLHSPDIWPGINGPAPEIASVIGKAPKRPPLKSEAKWALQQTSERVTSAKHRLDMLSERALKGPRLRSHPDERMG